MRLPFEDWLKEQKFSETVEQLFEESTVCYKSSAYRASFLISYLAFQSLIRERMLKSKKPTSLDSKYWDEILKNARNDDKWDATVFDALQSGSPKEIFKLTEDLRNQIKYFKNRRNDCAHGKKNAINYSLVETFWLFIQSNLSRLVVDESKESLVNRIKDHFDRTITPPDQDFSYLVKEIPHTIEPDKLEDFFKDVQNTLNDSPFINLYGANPDISKFFSGILDLPDKTIFWKAVEFLKGNEELLLAVLRLKPEQVICLSTEPSLIRRLWYKLLFVGRSDNDLLILVSLLRNKLIPDNQISEALEKIILRLSGPVVISDIHQELNFYGFFEKFKDIAFVKRKISNFTWANSNKDQIIYYLDNFEIDVVIAKSIAETFSNSYYPFALQDSLNNYFNKETQKGEKMAMILSELDYPIPDYLPALNKYAISS